MLQSRATTRGLRPLARRGTGGGAVGPRQARGFTVLELLVVIAIMGIFAALAVMAWTTLKSRLNQSNFINEFASTLGSSRLRAMSRQRNVVVIIDSTTTDGGFYQLDDLSPTQNLGSAANLATVAAAFDPSPTATNYGLASQFVVQLQTSQRSVKLPFIRETQVWGASTTFPFPFGAISVDTTQGCSFCTNGRGAVAFLTDGRALFSNAAPIGGVVVLGAGSQETTQRLRKAVLVGVSGIVQSVNK